MSAPDPQPSLPPSSFSRREALGLALSGSLAFVASPAPAQAVASAALGLEEFVPENDYPYFGYEPEAF